MKCLRCQQEIALARKCPYCGYKMPKDTVDDTRVEVEQTKDESAFRGRMNTRPERAKEGLFGLLPALIRYFSDPTVRSWRKSLIIFGLIYILSPLDLLPGAAFPLIGWTDDVMVFTLVWRLLVGELERYQKKDSLQ
jgi:uncharacterized membrane protein YkvA (DUF1232 family)